MKNKEIEFLTLAEIIEIHKNQLSNYGGEEGIRDISLLSSAIAMPKSTFEGNYLHKDLFEMAAAYVYHISQNHPFVDGNKRTALVSGLIFLDFNNIYLDDPKEELYKMMMNTASGKMNKNKIAEILRNLKV
jgi:death-on-curing protein